METSTASHRTRITENGRLLIPAEQRRRLGLEPGATVVLDIADGALRVRSLASAVAQAQALLRGFTQGGASMADELVAERRAAAATE